MQSMWTLMYFSKSYHFSVCTYRYIQIPAPCFNCLPFKRVLPHTPFQYAKQTEVHRTPFRLCNPWVNCIEYHGLLLNVERMMQLQKHTACENIYYKIYIRIWSSPPITTAIIIKHLVYCISFGFLTHRKSSICSLSDLAWNSTYCDGILIVRSFARCKRWCDNDEDDDCNTETLCTYTYIGVAMSHFHTIDMCIFDAFSYVLVEE